MMRPHVKDDALKRPRHSGSVMLAGADRGARLGLPGRSRPRIMRGSLAG